jgi:hypothetical protein
VEVYLASYPIRPPPHQGALLEAYVLRQGRPALGWVVGQSNRYFEVFWPRWDHRDCDHAAALDLVVWQLGDSVKSTSRWGAAQEVLGLLEGLEEVANTTQEEEL